MSKQLTSKTNKGFTIKSMRSARIQLLTSTTELISRKNDLGSSEHRNGAFLTGRLAGPGGPNELRTWSDHLIRIHQILNDDLDEKRFEVR